MHRFAIGPRVGAGVQGHDIVPIPGTKRRKYLEQKCGGGRSWIDEAKTCGGLMNHFRRSLRRAEGIRST